MQNTNRPFDVDANPPAGNPHAEWFIFLGLGIIASIGSGLLAVAILVGMILFGFRSGPKASPEIVSIAPFKSEQTAKSQTNSTAPTPVKPGQPPNRTKAADPAIAPKEPEPPAKAAAPDPPPFAANPPPPDVDPPALVDAQQRTVARAAESVALVTGRRRSGTAFLVAPGILATTSQVIADEVIADLRVRFTSAVNPDPDGIPVELVYAEKSQDLVLLRVRSDLRPIPLAKADEPVVRRTIAIIGNPSEDGGVQRLNEVCFGTVVDLVRVNGDFFWRLETETAPGNSGGPVVDTKTGSVVGIATTKLGDETCFAIPVSSIHRALNEAQKKGWDESVRVASAKHHLQIILENVQTLAASLENSKGIGVTMRQRTNAIEKRIGFSGESFSSGSGKGMSPQDSLAELKGQDASLREWLAPALKDINTDTVPFELRKAVFQMLSDCRGMQETLNNGTGGVRSFSRGFDFHRNQFHVHVADYHKQYRRFLTTYKRPLPLDPETAAASKLDMARMLAKAGKVERACQYCEEVIAKYPGTPVVAESQEVLEGLRSR